jgi:hypothetical protein
MAMSLGNFRGSAMVRIAILAVAYTAVLFAVCWLAYEIRFDFAVPTS